MNDIAPDFRRNSAIAREGRAVELILEDIPGGGVICKDDFKTDSTEMKEGALLGIDSNGIYHLTKTAEVWNIAASGADEIKVYKNHELKAGEFVINGARTGTSRAISSINTDASNNYDILTLQDSMDVSLAVNEILIQVSSPDVTGANALLLYTPQVIATDPVTLTADNTGSGLVVRGRVKESLLPYPVDSGIKALLPLITFK